MRKTVYSNHPQHQPEQ